MNKLSSILALLVLVAVACPVQADTVLYTTSTPISATLTDWASSLSFTQFDSSLGTLYKVELSLSSEFNTTLTVTNLGTDPASGYAKTEVQVTVQDSSTSPIVDAQLDFTSPSYNYADLATSASVTSGLLSASASSTETYTNSDILAEFTGTGSIILNASTQTDTLVSYSGGNTTATQVTSAALTGTVTYYYNPVPEPSTMLLLGIFGISFLGYTRRLYK